MASGGTGCHCVDIFTFSMHDNMTSSLSNCITFRRLSNNSQIIFDWSSFSFRFEIAIVSNHFWCAVCRSGLRRPSVSVYNGIFHGMFMENSTVAGASEQPCAFNLQPKAETVPSVTNTHSSHTVGSRSADTH